MIDQFIPVCCIFELCINDGLDNSDFCYILLLAIKIVESLTTHHHSPLGVVEIIRAFNVWNVNVCWLFELHKTFVQGSHLLCGLHVREIGPDDGAILWRNCSNPHQIPKKCRIANTHWNNAHLGKGNSLIDIYLIFSKYYAAYYWLKSHSIFDIFNEHDDSVIVECIKLCKWWIPSVYSLL